MIQLPSCVSRCEFNAVSSLSLSLSLSHTHLNPKPGAILCVNLVSLSDDDDDDDAFCLFFQKQKRCMCVCMCFCSSSSTSDSWRASVHSGRYARLTSGVAAAPTVTDSEFGHERPYITLLTLRPILVTVPTGKKL